MLKVKGVKNPLIMNSTEDRTQCMQDTTSENGREVGIPEAQTMRETQHTENLWVNSTRAKMMVEIYLPGEKQFAFYLGTKLQAIYQNWFSACSLYAPLKGQYR